MVEACRIERFKALLQTQVGLITVMTEDEARMQKAVLDREWKGLDALIQRMRATSQQISAVEDERRRCYEELRRVSGLDETASFYDVLAMLPEEDREELGDLYRRLRFSIGQVQSLVAGLDAYISSTTATMSRILEELFPARKVRLYGKTGARRLRDQPLVLNHSL